MGLKAGGKGGKGGAQKERETGKKGKRGRGAGNIMRTSRGLEGSGKEQLLHLAFF